MLTFNKSYLQLARPAPSPYKWRVGEGLAKRLAQILDYQHIKRLSFMIWIRRFNILF